MRYEINGEVVKFYLDNPKRHAETELKASFTGTGLTSLQIIPMLDATIVKYSGMRFSSQSSSVVSLRYFFAGFKTIRSPWPTNSSDWSVLVLRLFTFNLTDTNQQGGARARARRWSTYLNTLLTNLKDAEIIPLDVVIPSADAKKVRSLAKDLPILGQIGKRIVDPAEPTQKLLVDISFGMTDADYLEAVERKCRLLVGVIKDVSLKHWTEFIDDAERGRQMAAQVTDDDIDLAIAEQRYGEPISIPGKNGQHFTKYTSPSHPNGVHWALAIVRHALRTSSEIHCVTSAALRRSPFFNKSIFKGTGTDGAKISYCALNSLTSMASTPWEYLTSAARFYRFSGLLSPLDMAAACLLLTIEHPQFTAESLQNAKLLNVRGKPRLVLTDNNGHSIFYVDKPRAGKLKSATLSELAQKVLSDVVRCTAPVRDLLKRAGDKTWRYLFLGIAWRGYAPGVLSALDARANVLNADQNGLSLTKLYPALEQNGLGSGCFDYRRLRNTMGIIRWFETGSILEMSRKLGNTRKVALNNYLPPTLLHAWNTRIIRRFQNTLIVLAAHDEPYMLDVTDFSNLADLQHFIAQLILDYPAKTSPLGNEVQRRLGAIPFTPSAPPVSLPGFLNIRLTPKSLAHLYAFRDLALKTLSDEQQDKVDTLSGLSPRQFIDMAQLLTHAAENTELHPSLRENLDVPRLVETHGQALALKAKIDTQLAKLSIKREWEAA